MPTDYEVAVQEFQQADLAYKALEDDFSSGRAMLAIMKRAMTSGADAERVAMREWEGVWRAMQTALEERNVKLKNAKDKLRQAVQLTQTQWRGVDGTATMLDVGGFKVSSVTSRTFDAKSLFDLVERHGKTNEMMALVRFDKEGKPVPAIRAEWKIEFETVLNWLKANNMQDVIDGAYDEIEKTPMVKGLKPISFLGEKKDD